MSDIYYQPRRTQYKSQYVPMPLDFMQKSLQAKQAKWDTTQLALDELSDKEFNALQGEDKKKAKAVQQKIQDFVDESTSKDLGSSEYAREFKNFQRQIKQDKDLKAVQSAYAQQQELEKMKEDWIAEGKTLESMPEVWYEADRRLKEYTQGKGYKGNVRLLDIGDIRPGVDIMANTQKWFDKLAKDTNTTLNGNEWGITLDKVTGSAKNLFNSWLASPEGQQYLRRYDAQQRQWSGSINKMSDKPEVTLDINGNAIKDENGDPIMRSEYQKYQLAKRQDAYDFLRNIGAQRIGVKPSNSSLTSNQNKTFTDNTQGTNIRLDSSTAIPEKANDITNQNNALININERIDILKDISERTDLEDEELVNLENAKEDLKITQDANVARTLQTVPVFAVEQNIVADVNEYNEIKNTAKNTLNDGKYSAEITEDLNSNLTEEEFNDLKDVLEQDLESIPTQELREHAKALIAEEFPDGFTNSIKGVTNLRNKLTDISEAFPYLFPQNEILDYTEDILLRKSISEEMIKKQNDGKNLVIQKDNKMTAFLERDNSTWTYQENSFNKGYETTGSENKQGDPSIWQTNPHLIKMREKGIDGIEALRKAQETMNNKLLELENYEGSEVAYVGFPSYDGSVKRYDNSGNEIKTTKAELDKGINTFKIATNAVNEILDLAGNLSQDEFEEKINEYHTVAQDVRLDKKVDKKKRVDGKLSDAYKDAFNKTVLQSTTSPGETLYEGETKFLNTVFPPNSILTQATVKDGDGNDVNNEYLKSSIFGEEVPDNAQISVKKTNWNNRYLNRDKNGNFRYTGTFDLEATWLDEDNKPQSMKRTTDNSFVISTAGTIDPNNIKQKLVSLKTNENKNINNQFNQEWNNSQTDLQKVNAINKKVNQENENILEVSMLTDPSFYRKMSNIEKSFNVDAYYKTNKKGKLMPFTIPTININRVVPGTNGQNTIAKDTFKINKLTEGKEEGMFQINFTTEEGERKTVSKGPFKSYKHALNVIYNYKMLSQESDASAQLNKTSGFVPEEVFTEVSEEVDTDYQQ